MMSFDDIARILASHRPTFLAAAELTRAAVTLILRKGTAGLEVLFIERATHDGDPWSGNLGFPGGKAENTDKSPRQAAEREVREEIGLDLCSARYLGRLSDITGAHLPVHVACFVYGVDELPPFALSNEIRDCFWVTLAELRNPERHIVAPVHFGVAHLERPAILIPQPDKPVLWGLTYRLVMQFLELLPE
jgi:8-oxo-dGTP pyrophosphatase MutT (NUDIX family)